MPESSAYLGMRTDTSASASARPAPEPSLLMNGSVTRHPTRDHGGSRGAVGLRRTHQDRLDLLRGWARLSSHRFVTLPARTFARRSPHRDTIRPVASPVVHPFRRHWRSGDGSE